MKTLFNPRTGEFTEFQDTLFCSAFAESGLDPTGSGSKGAPIVGSYTSTADTLATILANAYFDSYATTLKNNQLLYLTGTDGNAFARCTVSGTTDVKLVGISCDPQLIIETIASTGSTGTDLAQTGVTIFASTFAGTYNLPMPQPGQGERVLITNTTAAIVVTSSAAKFDYTGQNTITFNGIDQTVTLIPITSTLWYIRDLYDVPSTAAVAIVLS